MNPRPVIRFSVLAASIALVLVQCQPAVTKTRIVLITLDTLRYDAVFPPEAKASAIQSTQLMIILIITESTHHI